MPMNQDRAEPLTARSFVCPAADYTETDMQEHLTTKKWRFALGSPEQTRELARRMAVSLCSGGTIAFYGGLGSGKTTFIQALAGELGCKAMVTSPTYTIINRYDCDRMPIIHVDCYRIRHEDELWDIGLAEMFVPGVLVCVEWSEHCGGILPCRRLEIRLESDGRDRRRVEITALGGIWPALDTLLDGISEDQ